MLLKTLLWLIHVDVWEKSTQSCKAIIPQFKKIKVLLGHLLLMHVC